jgi:hypothetical protein
MLELECRLYALVLHYCRLLAKDIEDTKLCDQPAPGVNHPAWILGHLAVCTDYAARLLGDSMACPKEWHKKFGPGSSLSTNRSDYPSKAELMAAVEAGHERVTGSARQVTAERLAQPQPGPFFKTELPTVGDLLGHLMTTHPCTHLGQLSTWRRCMGLGSVLNI